MLSGNIKVGDTVCVNPQQGMAIVQKIINGYDDVQEANTGENVTLQISIKAERGSMITHFYQQPTLSKELEGTICWLCEDVLDTDKEYLLRINAMETVCRIAVLHKIDIHSYDEYESKKPLNVNEFARVQVNTTDVVAYDAFDLLQDNGRGIIIDMETGGTFGAIVFNIQQSKN
jgi:sulfate adenylyltransferase subunit 1 (EFTu-like GTPase family)